ncbi:MAG: hypothetical protein DRN21_03330 [Thermoplasmata archaeon]|nr:MAG: hypothetical protein DRN21_03330 [Thermoplasmata archaeon]
MEKNDLLGLHTGIGDVIENGKRIGECIFDLEIVMMPTGKIEAQGVIDEVTDGTINFEERDAVFKISGVISRENAAYATEFTCTISPTTYPKFIVVDTEELFANLAPLEETEEPAKS